MIEFKRAGDAMVFECPSFTIEVCAGSERIAINEAAANDPRAKEVITHVFEVLDMIIEHKARQATAMSADINICEGINTDIEALKRRVVESNNNLRCVAGD